MRISDWSSDVCSSDLWADLVLVAPATADFMARLAHGHGNDLLTTLCLATAAPIALAPAMNRLMWADAVTQKNRLLLEGDGVHLFGPGVGDQACGETGAGRIDRKSTRLNSSH